MLNKQYIGSDFDEFLQSENILEETETIAVKRVLAYELEEKMKRDNMSLTKLAKELQTSRAAINRIFDASNTSITLNTMEKIARYVGKRLVLSFT